MKTIKCFGKEYISIKSLAFEFDNNKNYQILILNILNT